MDLLQTVRKEGSRGGRADFKWEDVKNDQHRENYLGHSLMAPVGRWQINKDLSWYAKGDEDGAPSAEDIRKEEIRRIKEAEADAINIALGFPVASKNPNLAPLGEKASESDVKKALAQGTGAEESDAQKGIGYGSSRGRHAGTDTARDVLEGKDDERPPPRDIATQGKARERRRSRSGERHRRSRHHDRDRHERRRSRSGERERHRRARSSSRETRRRRHRSRSRERLRSPENRNHGRERSPSRERRRYRSRSPREYRGSDRYERRDHREYQSKDRRRSRSPHRDHRTSRIERS